MTTDIHDNDIPDTDLRDLFAGVQPAANFEDRLVTAVRQRQRLRLPIPPALQRAAIAAAAVLAVGSIGYLGNRAMTGRLNESANHAKLASNRQQTGLAIGLNENKSDPFAGGSKPNDRWKDWWPSDTVLSDQLNATKSEITDATSRREHSSTAFKSALLPSAQGDMSQVSDRLNRVSSGHGVRYDYQGTRHAAEGNAQLGGGGYNAPSGGQPTGGIDAKIVTGLVVDLNNGDAREYDGPTAANGGKLTFKDTAGPQSGGQSPSSTTSDRFRPQSITQSNVTDNTISRDASGNVVANKVKSSRSLDWVSNVGNAAVPGSIASNSSDHFNPVASPPPEEIVYRAKNIVALADPSEMYPNGHTPDVGKPTPNGTGPATTSVTDDRKIIRTGSMEFEVDRFDTAQTQITKIVGELGGFVGATDSTKLPNGKVRGSISVRVPPERLDTLVLSLRALGDLKSQQITAADITKEYTDIQSELAADRAMQDRLLDLIHKGNGSVKDLLAAENELGNWRTKIEKAEGMIRYYNGQVLLSTLSITLSERDIQTAATAVETETADVGIEADDVEKARTTAMKTIDEAKGRIVEAELKRFDAGQLAARLVADVPPESAGAVIDQLKLLGKVARLEVHRQQTNDGTVAVINTTPLRTERKPTRLLISIYNLANVAPRRTTNVSLAANDVEAAYAALISMVKSIGGRVVTSTLDRGDPVKASGTLALEIAPDKLDAAMMALHTQGDVLNLNLKENPDTQNSTEAKVGLTVQLVALAAVAARESVQQTLAVTDVPAAYQTILSAAGNNRARVLTASLNEQDRQNITADILLEVPRATQLELEKTLNSTGGTIARTSARSADAEGTVDSKVQLKLSITSADHLAARETTRLQVEVIDVDKSAADAQAAAITAGGRVLEANITKDHGKGTARVILDFPFDKLGDVLQQMRNEGTVRGIDTSRDQQAPTGSLAHGQIYVEFRTADAIVADQTGPWSSIRQGLSTSVAGLMWSLQWVVVGLCLIGPWAGIGWVAWKLLGKNRMTKSRIVND